jgi:hypothetical protein
MEEVSFLLFFGSCPLINCVCQVLYKISQLRRSILSDVSLHPTVHSFPAHAEIPSDRNRSFETWNRKQLSSSSGRFSASKGQIRVGRMDDTELRNVRNDYAHFSCP